MNWLIFLVIMGAGLWFFKWMTIDSIRWDLLNARQTVEQWLYILFALFIGGVVMLFVVGMGASMS